MTVPKNISALNTSSKRETALITGASSGIGLDLARLMARDFDLILSARNQAKLEQIAGELQQHGNQMQVVPADLAQADGPEQLFSEIKQRGLRVDALINNAGFGGYGAFADTGLQTELEMIQVNIASLTHLTKLALPGMRERRHGRIMNVASVAGFPPGPLMAVYYATKAYVVSFSEAIANELKDSGITVTCLCPGATDTEFQRRANMGHSRLLQMGVMRSSEVARAGYRAMMRGQTLIIPGARNWLLVESLRISPRKMVAAIPEE